MTVWLDDGDVRLYLGDALETVRGMPDETVDCVVTSPPYWGLRDYGTGSWDGGDPDCDHQAPVHLQRDTSGGVHGGYGTRGEQPSSNNVARQYRDVCGKCGATRTDRQMGLEPTPDLFVAGMVELFREIRRVLAPHGTCWVNLGDSYASSPPGNVAGVGATSGLHGANDASGTYRETLKAGHATKRNTVVDGLKPKDLCGIPWRVAFALQADGWWLRSDIIWAKPNPMPESVTDRPTKAHEYVFLLTKQPRYWFDTEAVREPAEHPPFNGFRGGGAYIEQGTGASNVAKSGESSSVTRDKTGERPAGRNVRSVWNIATQPYPEAHFATFPEELARRCILAGCPIRVCRVCGKPSERIVERGEQIGGRIGTTVAERTPDPRYAVGDKLNGTLQGGQGTFAAFERETVGWSECECMTLLAVDAPQGVTWRPGVVLDPFIGSGTVAKVARDHQRHAIGIDLNETYLELAARRLQQLSLLT